MGAAISIFVLMSLSIFIIRIAAVAMRLTGLDDSSARFQALSAFTGTGFTTTESEMIVNYPVRRRIVSVLMIIGNLGLVGVFATLVASIVQTDGKVDAVMEQLGWLLGGLALLWFLMLNKAADRLICGAIGKVLNATTQLGRRKYHRVLQIGDGLSVCEHPFETMIDIDALDSMGLKLMAVRNHDGNIHTTDGGPIDPDVGGWLIAYGDDKAHDALGERS
jgi:hypothetical protein